MAGETAFWNSLKTRLNEQRIHTLRVTEKTTGGIPDVLWLDQDSGDVGWLELKSIEVKTKRSKPLIDLRKDQALFLRDWVKRSGRAGVLVRVNFSYENRVEFWYFEALSHMDWVAIWPRPSQEQILKYRDGLWKGELNIEQLIENMTR